MNTLPSERDLPPAARDAARARLVAAADRPPAPVRRWTPVVAAAGLAAVVGVSVAGVAVYRDDPAPARTASAPAASSPAGFSRADLLARCLSLQPRGQRSPDLAGSRVFVVFEDRYGYMIQAGNARLSFFCSFPLDGTQVSADGGGGEKDAGAYLDRPGVNVALEGYGDANFEADGSIRTVGRPGLWVSGRVSRKVARVVITWPGAAPVTAALDGPYFLARGPVARRPAGDPRPDMIVAYDAAGHEVGRTN